VLLLAFGLVVSGCQPAAAPARAVHETEVVFLATPQLVAERMLELAQVTPADVVYDLGCGDGRIVVTAAVRHGARGIGLEIHAERVRAARERARAAGVAHLVEIVHGDLFEVDVSEATVVALYLFPELNDRLVPQLRRLRPGARIVSHDFGFGALRPERVLRVQGPEYDGAAAWRTHELLLWRAPLPQ
jgi:SAM-dependent methyltransferase